jgi:predicted anti-sigma-YlaC factor YlaD
MFCDEILELIEPIAAGDLTLDGRTSAHLASCADCAAALEMARGLERVLRTRAAPRPTPQFTARIMGRLRRDRWRREQFLDAGFNLAIGLVLFGVLVAAWLLLSRSGLTGVGQQAVDVLNAAVVGAARRVVPSLPLYAGAAALLASALGLWWWAERDITPW